MATPVAPTSSSIIAEGLRRAGYSSPSSALVARAGSEWMEEIKQDINIIEKRLSSLLRVSSPYSTVASSGSYSLPSDYGEIANIRMSGVVEPLTLINKNDYNTHKASPSYGIPLSYSISVNDGSYAIELIPTPNAIYTYTVEYYADITLVDTESSILSSVYRTWRNLWVQGIKAKCLEWDDDSRAQNEISIYWNLLKSVVGRDSSFLKSPIQCVVGDYS
jgi:hypothetical protein